VSLSLEYLIIFQNSFFYELEALKILVAPENIY